MGYRIQATATIIDACKSLSPEMRSAAKKALNELARDPFMGRELQGNLLGFWSSKILRYRIIYQINLEAKILMVFAIGPRRDIYENIRSYLSKNNSYSKNIE